MAITVGGNKPKGGAYGGKLGTPFGSKKEPMYKPNKTSISPQKVL